MFYANFIELNPGVSTLVNRNTNVKVMSAPEKLTSVFASNTMAASV